MKFVANLNLKGHQFFLTHPVCCSRPLYFVLVRAIQGVPKKPKTIENDLLLEFQCTKLNPRVDKVLT